MGTIYDSTKIRELLEENLNKLFEASINEAKPEEVYKALATTINDIMRRKRREFNTKVKTKKAKRIYYLSMEFLMGKSLRNNISNLGLFDAVEEVVQGIGFTIEDLCEYEPDAGLGNGGLGRLGACFLDALSSLQYPATGFSLRYEYGFFKQKIDHNGWQTETPDVWLPAGDVWLTIRTDKVFTVKFDGEIVERHINGKTYYDYKNYNEVEAIPYDMMVPGAESEAVSALRLWRSRNVHTFDINSFSQGDYIKAMREYNDAELITKVLYPANEHYEGKVLRLKQQYFLVSASIQSIITDHFKNYGDIRSLPKHVAIHINDTHPALCIPELMRILIDDFQLGWDESWEIVTKTVAYTNHTIMAEALEKWEEFIVREKLPRIYVILQQIDRKFRDEARCLGVKNGDIDSLAVFSNDKVHMANLCVIASHKVNGVSGLHSNIIKESIFNGYYKMTPEKFTNVTNGIAYRRWLCQSNPLLNQLLEEKIGHDFYKDAVKLEKFEKFIDDKEVLERLEEIKYKNKCDFAKYLYKKEGIVIDPKTRFDVQVKRLHEYKRQLLNVLKIVYLLTQLEENYNVDFTPQTFIFGAKAAPSYLAAKQVIQLIYCLSKEIEKRPEIRERLNVIFTENYCVTTAEKLMPASEVSEQISLAGKEASGTGNMKFMINGALTLGTLDGANVEMNENLDGENIFIFGLKSEEVKKIYEKGYNPYDYFNSNEKIRKVLNRLNQGFNGQSFAHITDYLLNRYPQADPYMCLADFDSYLEAHYKMDELYKDKTKWNKASLMNIARAGIFSADRSIKEYAENIWNIKRI